MAVAKIVIEEPRQKWRYRCPRGHTNWSLTNSHIWCPSCSRQHDADPEHFELVDHKTGKKIARERIDLRI